MRRWTRAGAWAAGVAAAAVAAVMVVGGAGAPRAYHDPWHEDYHGRFADARLQLVALALLAPSGHNMQPWRIRLDPVDPASMELFVDTDRLTPVVDPLARQTLVSQGAFLEYMQVAAQQLGMTAGIDLFPAGPPDEDHLVASLRGRPVARITVAPGAHEGGPVTAEYEAMFHPDTNRAPFADRPVTAARGEELVAAGTRAGSTAGVAGVQVGIRGSAPDLGAITALAQRGTDIESGLAAAGEETAAVLRPNERRKDATRFGFSVEGQGTSGVAMYLTQGLITLVPGLVDGDSQAERQRAAAREALAHTPAFLVVRTSGNTRAEQVAAGMAYARVCLRAHAVGLAVQPLSQVLEEYPEMADEYAAAHRLLAPDGGTVQMLLRVGVPTREYPTSMRLGVEDVVEGS